MRYYHVVVTGDRYPTEYNVKASGWPTAAARAAREWQKRFKGSRTETLSFRITKGV